MNEDSKNSSETKTGNGLFSKAPDDLFAISGQPEVQPAPERKQPVPLGHAVKQQQTTPKFLSSKVVAPPLQPPALQNNNETPQPPAAAEEPAAEKKTVQPYDLVVEPSVKSGDISLSVQTAPPEPTAVQTQPPAEKAPAHHQRHRVHHPEPAQEKVATARKQVSLGPNASSFSLGQIMKEARIAAGYSVAQVDQNTKIKKDYLDALECDNMGRLPPPVFIAAYIRSLCALYNMDSDAVKLASEKLKALSEPADVPDTIINNIEKDSFVNMEEVKKVKRMVYIGVGTLLVIISLITTIIVASYVRKSSSNTTVSGGTHAVKPVPGGRIVSSDKTPAPPVFNSEALDTLSVPQNPPMRALRMKK